LGPERDKFPIRSYTKPFEMTGWFPKFINAPERIAEMALVIGVELVEMLG